MRSRIFAVLLAAVTVLLGVWAFWPTSDVAIGRGDLASDEASLGPAKDPRAPRREISTAPDSPAQRAAVAPPLAETATTGRILVHLTPEESARDAALVLDVAPSCPAPVRTPDGWRIDDVPPEVYQITIRGSDIVPVVARGLRVVAAKTSEYTAKLETGVRCAGRIFDALTKTGVPGAEVRILDQARFFTDTSGRFSSEQLIAKSALREIVVRALDYDQVVYKNFPIVDPGDIQLAVGGGGCELIATFENNLGGPLPKRIHAKIAISPGVWDVRREGEFDGRDEVRFKNLYATDYRVEVRFPDGEHPAILAPFTIKTDQKTIELTLPLTPGTTLSGKVVGPPEVLRGLELDLINGRAEVIAESRVSPEGVYQFKNLQPGEYIPRLKMGALVNQVPPITIVAGEALAKDIDALRHVFVEAK